MARVVGIVGSPRKERGLTDRLVHEALAGAAAHGLTTQTIYLADLDLKPCIACGGACFQDEICRQDPASTQLSALVNQFDALILGAPVYTWRPNSITAIFQDKLRLKGGSVITGSRPGRPALGIAVAGGTGSGIFGAIQSMYRWLAVWAFRPLPPVLVTRYNLDSSLVEARLSGERLASAVESARPFKDLAECLLSYDSLPYLREGFSDEFFWLARQLDAGLPVESSEPRVHALREGLRAAEVALSRGERDEAARLVAPAYLAGREAWLALEH